MVTWVKDDIGAVESAVNIGVIKQENELTLIDTGIDNSAVNKVRKQFDMDVTSALITHHHADHMGGASKLENLGVTQIYGPAEELPLIHNTLLEPYTMFGGAHPPELLRNRHLEARSAPSVKSTELQSIADVISCPGHTPDHQAFRFTDVLFTGDSAFTQETIEKYHLLFAVNPANASLSIDSLLEVEFDIMIPGHGPIQYSRSDATQVLKDTKRHYESTQDDILSIIGEKLEFDQYISNCLEYFELTDIVKNRGYLQYVLYQVPLQGYLSNILDQNLVNIDTKSGKPIIYAE